MSMPEAKNMGRLAEKAFCEAVSKALDRHRRLGNPIAIMRDDKVLILESVPTQEKTTSTATERSDQ